MNERIDHSNYEAWLLDRLEGNLSADQERLLEAFLLLHPELAVSEGDLPTVSHDGSFPGAFDKVVLKRQVPPVSPVSLTNAEDYLIARLEGDLDAAAEQALDAYLQDHPELRTTARLFEMTRVVMDDLDFVGKPGLHRQLPPVGLPNAINVEDFLVARVEGALDAHQEAALDRYLTTDPKAVRDSRILSMARIPATRIPYPNKDSLKRGGRVLFFAPINWQRLAAAATVLLLLSIGSWFLFSPGPSDQGITEVPVEPNKVLVPKIQKEPAPRQALAESAPLVTVGPGPERLNEQVTLPSEEGEAPLKASTARRSEIVRMRTLVPAQALSYRTPVSVVVAQVKVDIEDPSIDLAHSQAMTIPELVASTLRERVLEMPSKEPRPLDVDDAVAAVDIGLKAVGGAHAGLDVERRPNGSLLRFNLRLGRNLAISAQR